MRRRAATVRAMRTTGLLIAGALALVPVPALASCHLMEIVEIFAGTDDCPDAHYLVLRMTALAQDAVQGTSITNLDGSTFGAFAAGTTLANAELGSNILMATARAEGLFGIAADGVADGLLAFPEGRVTYSCSADAVLYGSIGAEPALVRGMALKKDGVGDWALGAPTPVNNANQTGTLGTCPPNLDGGEPPPDEGPDPDAGEPGETATDEGCGCRVGGAPAGSPAWIALLALAALARRRRS